MKLLNRFLFLFFAVVLSSCDPATINGILNGTTTSTALSNEEVVQGLREALKVGTEKSVSLASAADGFWKNPAIKIPFPEEAIKVKNTAINLGLGTQVQNFELNLNRAAEKAAKEAAPIFVNAITKMTISDGFTILKGDSIAATRYLKNATTDELKQKFSPIVQQAIDAVELTSYYEPLANAYNTATILTGGNAVNPDLNAYVTGKALDGLFFHIAKEEQKIRKDPAARVTEILKKVFGSPEALNRN